MKITGHTSERNFMKVYLRVIDNKLSYDDIQIIKTYKPGFKEADLAFDSESLFESLKTTILRLDENETHKL